MERNQDNNTTPQNVFQQPVWDATTKFEITGQELEILVRANEQNSQAALVFQNLINNGLLDGKIRMKYFKVNESGSGYTPMSDDEAKPYDEDLQNLIKQAKDVAAQAKKQVAEGQEGKATRLDAIVNQHGEPYEDLSDKKLKVVE